ncbi:hypothetical protein ACFY4B_18230 [Kitasatospora sp. NPDC001261]
MGDQLAARAFLRQARGLAEAAGNVRAVIATELNLASEEDRNGQ